MKKKRFNNHKKYLAGGLNLRFKSTLGTFFLHGLPLYSTPSSTRAQACVAMMRYFTRRKTYNKVRVVVATPKSDPKLLDGENTAGG